MENKDLKELIHKAKALFNTIEKFQSKYEKVLETVEQSRDKYQLESELKNLFVAKINNREYQSYQLEMFCTDFRFLVCGYQSYSYISNLYKENYSILKKQISSLKRYESPILRFISNKIKERGEESFDELKSFIDKYETIVKEHINNTYSLYNENFDEILNDYKVSNLLRNETIQFIKKRVNRLSLSFLNESVNAYYSYIEDLKNRIPNLEKIKAEVKKKVDKVVATELQKKLAEVPIDELNKDKSGIRISALRSNGIETLKQLFGYDVCSLECLEGIGEQSAYIIYKKYKAIEHDLLKTIRLRINVDRKTKEMTQLLKVTIDYYFKNKNVDKMEEIISNIINLVKPDLAIINKYNYCYNALFINEDEIEAIRTAKLHIDDIKKTDIFKKFTALEKEIKKSNKFSDAETWKFFTDNSIEINKILEELVPELFSDDKDTFYGLPSDLAQQIQEECFFPDGLNCELRRYQEWGVKYILHQERVLLGDEMGLGKTIQAIAVMVSLKNLGCKHFLVVCPASLVINWVREISKHSKLTVFKIHGNGKSNIFQKWQTNGGVGVTTYEALASLSFPENFKIDQLIVDEAHYIKNINTKRSKNTIKVSEISNRVLFMTGTPIENNVDEMIALIEVLQPKIAAEVKPFAYSVAASRFREMIIPVYYRRKREDVLSELPELIEKEEWCTMGEREINEYYATLGCGHYMTVRRLSWNIDNLEFSSKAQRLKEIIEEAKEEGRKVIVFSYFLDVINKIFMFLKEQCLIPITGRISAIKRQDIIDKFIAADPGTVLLSQIIAGGTGLNLQTASVVVLCEPQIKPSIEDQAISRAYRMGQSRNVLVFKLLCEDTIDERIQEILEQKKEEFMLYADKSVAAEKIEKIDDNTMKKIIQDEIDRIAREKNIDVKTYKSNEKNDEINLDQMSDMIKESTINVKKTENEYLPDDNYYENLLTFSYRQIVEKLLEKYGKVNGDYFIDDIGWSINDSIKKGNIGLNIHHIDEDKYMNLSNVYIAKKYPFELQKKERLVYCDILEHLILHIKIAIETIGSQTEYSTLKGIGGAITYIIPQINDIYSDKEFESVYSNESRKRIKDHFKSYIKVLQYLLNGVSKNEALKQMVTKEVVSETFENGRLEKVYQSLK